MLTFSLDEATDREPSVENRGMLNEFLVRLRPLIKNAKNHVIHSLTRKISLLNKKLEHKENPKLSKKKENILAKLKLLTKINRDRLSKQILGFSLEGPCASNDAEFKVVQLLYERPLIKKEIDRFKAEHSDWVNLINYILYKNTSGKLKKRPQREKASKRMGTLPLPQIPIQIGDDKDSIDIKPANLSSKEPSLENQEDFSQSSIKNKDFSLLSKTTEFSDIRSESNFETDEKLSDPSTDDRLGNSDDEKDEEESENGSELSSCEELSNDDEEAIVSARDDSDSDNPLGQDDKNIREAKKKIADRSDNRSKKQFFGGGPMRNTSKKSEYSASRNKIVPHGGFGTRWESSDRTSNYNFKKQQFVQPNRSKHGKFVQSDTLVKEHSNKPLSNSKPSSNLKDIHPSWKAKQEQKQKLKINMTSQPTAKKIKFSDD